MASYSQLQTSFTSTSFDNGPDSADSYGSGQFNYPQDPYYASYTAANEIKDSHQRPYSNQNAQQQQHAAWPVRDDHYPPFSNQLPASTHDRTYNEIPLINRSSSQDHRTSYPHDASTFSPFNPTPSSQPAPLHLSAYAIRQPHPPALDPAYSTFLDSRYARDGGYVNAHRLEAPHPNYPSTPINVVPNTSYATSRSIPPNDPSHLSTNQGPNAENVTICEWEGCGRALDDDTCRGVRSHLKQYHCNGISPAAGTMLRCMWGGRCRREPMKWENMPKHVAECHTKSMMRVCDYCRVSFSRGDALKRHLEAGNCASGPRIG
ncbi:hypothetical protein C2E23DRAFT_859887 [Lenzites betulinus]|nr:hypothetical protein C2E23DRAFT_859887 [Lenzites betulinus]